MNKYTLTYHSPEVEQDYLREQLDPVIDRYRDLSKLLILLFVILAIYMLAKQNYFAFSLNAIIEILLIIQYIYFKQRKTLSCSLIIAFVNICLTLERVNFILNEDSYSTDENASFVMGMSFMVLHQTLLVDPRFWFNSIVLFLITTSYCISDAFYRLYVTQGISPFIFSILFQVYANYQQQKIKREKYLFKRKQNNSSIILFVNLYLDYIVCKVVQDPCCVLSYDLKRNLFGLKDDNSAFQDLFQNEQLLSITQKLSSVEVQNTKQNLLSAIFKQYERQSNNLESIFFDCLFHNYKLQCQVYIDCLVQPTFVIAFSNIQRQRQKLESLKKANELLNTLSKQVLQHYLKKIKIIYRSLIKINKSRLSTQEIERLRTLENKTKISYIISKNINWTINIKNKSSTELIQQFQIQRFNFLILIKLSIIPLFRQKIKINHSLNLEDQNIFSLKNIFSDLIVIICSLSCFKMSKHLSLSFENDKQIIRISGKFSSCVNQKFNLSLAAAKSNLKILGPTSDIRMSENNRFLFSIYKDLRPLMQ